MADIVTFVCLLVVSNQFMYCHVPVMFPLCIIMLKEIFGKIGTNEYLLH